MPYRKTSARIAHAERVRTSITEAAIELIRDGGISALTVRAVVDRAGSSVGNYYHHFGTKEALLVSVAELLIERIGSRSEQVAIRARQISTTNEQSASEEQVAASAARLAALIMTGISAALEDSALARVLFIGTPGSRTRQLVIDSFISRTTAELEKIPADIPMPGRVVKYPELLASLWQGSIMMTIEQILSLDFDIDSIQAGRLCAEWNLRAIGFQDGIIDRAIAAASSASASLSL